LQVSILVATKRGIRNMRNKIVGIFALFAVLFFVACNGNDVLTNYSDVEIIDLTKFIY